MIIPGLLGSHDKRSTILRKCRRIFQRLNLKLIKEAFVPTSSCMSAPLPHVRKAKSCRLSTRHESLNCVCDSVPRLDLEDTRKAVEETEAL